MSITEEFLKLRSSGTPELGEWNVNYEQALALAKKNNKFIVTCWSNGDLCRYCVDTEVCMMQQVFIDWMKTSDAYFVFQYSGDPDKGQTLYNWIFNGTGVSKYPGFRITLYDKSNPNKMVVNRAMDGKTLRGNKVKAYGANEMIANLNAIFALRPKTSNKANESKKGEPFKIRLNEKNTTKQVNKVLDAIDANGGYCPCQPKSEGTKCHCVDFIENKKIGEPCICNIYVKKASSAAPKLKRR